MNITRNLKLAGEVGNFTFHAEPITYTTFCKNIALLAELKKQLSDFSSPQDWANIAFIFFKQANSENDILNESAQSLINAIGREINVFVDDKAIALETLIAQKRIDDESADMIYSQILFFTLMQYLPFAAAKTSEKMNQIIRAWTNCQTTSLKAMDYFRSLSTLTTAETTGESLTDLLPSA